MKVDLWVYNLSVARVTVSNDVNVHIWYDLDYLSLGNPSMLSFW